MLIHQPSNVEMKCDDNDNDDSDNKHDDEDIEEELSMEIILSNLGSSIGQLESAKQKTLCFNTIKSIKERAQKEKEQSTQYFQEMLSYITKEERYVHCINT